MTNKNANSILIAIIYAIPILLGLNLFLKIKNRNENRNTGFFEKLHEVGYYKQVSDPYQPFTVQYINPHYLFSVPIDSNERKQISNSTVSLLPILGYRKTLTFSEPPGKERIKRKCLLVLGGSVAFGHGVSSNDKTLASNLQRKLGSTYKVYNLAIPSWNSRQELISVLNFFNKDERRYCETVDSISLTVTNDIHVTVEYLSSNKFSDEAYREELISAPESFVQLDSLVSDIRKKNSYISIASSFIDLTKQVFLGGILNSSSSKSVNSVNVLDNIGSLDNIQRSFLRRQVRAFFKNQIAIKQYIELNGNGKHLIVLQPDIKNEKIKSIWSYSNSLINNEGSKYSDLRILDLRLYMLSKQKKLPKSNSSTTLRKSYSYSPASISKESINDFDFYDDAHLTDIGMLKVSNKIYKKYLSIIK